MNNKTYQEWIQDVQWLRTKIILPDGKRIDKSGLMTNEQLDADKLNEVLTKEYNSYKRISQNG